MDTGNSLLDELRKLNTNIDELNSTMQQVLARLEKIEVNTQNATL